MSDAATLVADRYRLVARIGTGGMGVVWKAWDERLHRTVALKELHPQPGLSAQEAQLANSRAMREARITARLHHPNAVPVFDVVEQDGHPCLVMQYLPSEPLSELLKRGLFEPRETARVGGQVASALAAAHSVGIVHRDIKPGNVLIAEDGTARISDFGISHALGDVTLTSTGMVTGTPAYLAPEVARGGDFGFAADVFALGATLYTALEGTPPFGVDPNPMALLHRVASGSYTPPQRAGMLTSLLTRLLARDPAARPSMKEAADALTALAASPPPPAAVPVHPEPGARTTEVLRPEPPPRPPVPVEARPRRGRGAAVVAAVVVGLAVATGLLLAVLHLGAGGTPHGSSVAPAPSSGSSGSSGISGTSSPSTAPPTKHSSSGSPSPSRGSSTSTHSSATSSTSSRSSTSSGSTASGTSAAPTSGTASTAPVRAAGAPSAGDLSRAVTSYYALMPGNTAAGYARLTSAYRSTHASSRGSYERFWSAIAGVSTSGVSVSPPGSVTATITYRFKDGHVVRERTAYGLVQDGGILKIDSSRVLSSR